jgi:hypothetical protein
LSAISQVDRNNSAHQIKRIRISNQKVIVAHERQSKWTGKRAVRRNDHLITGARIDLHNAARGRVRNVYRFVILHSNPNRGSQILPGCHNRLSLVTQVHLDNRSACIGHVEITVRRKCNTDRDGQHTA